MTKLSDWKNKGIYFVKDLETIRRYETRNSIGGVIFKTKIIRPVLYLCECENHADFVYVHLYRLNPQSQFTTVDHSPLEHFCMSYYKNNGQEASNSNHIHVEDFILLGWDVDQLRGTYWGGVLTPLGSRLTLKDVINHWEPFAIENGFEPTVNPFYKSKKERELATAKDFFGQTIRIGDQVVFTLIRDGRGFQVGNITNITIDNVVIDARTVTPHKCVIKYPKA